LKSQDTDDEHSKRIDITKVLLESLGAADKLLESPDTTEALLNSLDTIEEMFGGFCPL
jgi:hypothetical protein